MGKPQRPDSRVFDTTSAPTAQSVTPSVEATIEQARQTRQLNADLIGRRLRLGERVSAEVLYETLHAHTLAGWWLLVERHIQRSQSPEKTVARFVSWISPYQDDDSSACSTATGCGSHGPHCGRESAVAHIARALTLIRQDAARTFVEHVTTLAPASCAEQEEAEA
ncbi:hypothetical protein AB0K18_12200 [Nonomuraea sp. NPDC049421]|uniref:hypothetical protein n=1 Tax=Nonomuraea sp. NPDC049421 TaxID=3155275 RepID=UPI00342DA68D